MFKVKINGLEDLERQLKKLDAKVAKKIVSQECREGAKVIAAAIHPPVDTGRLSRAIKVRSFRKKKRGQIAFTAQIGEGFYKGKSFYGAFVDQGTHKLPKQEFMKKGFDEKVEGLKESIPQAIAKRIEAEGQK
jgi:HK97 gp10 family phage protein